MSDDQQAQRSRRGTLGVAMVAAVLLVVGLVVLVTGIRGSDGPPQPAAAPASTSAAVDPGAGTPPTSSTKTPATTAPSPAKTAAAPKSDLGTFLGASAPTSIAIPSIGLSSKTFVPLTVQSNGTISVPGTENEVGVYRDGPTPGQLGPAVLAAHVDSPQGRQGVFYRLGAVKAGDQVRITRADRTTLTFVVDRVQAFKKTEFPTDLVYKGDFKRSEIRLVTCGGPVDSANEYRDNVVVFGHLTSAKA